MVWLNEEGDEEAMPHVILRSEQRDPPQPRASPKYLLVAPLPSKYLPSLPPRWVHCREVVPLDARLAAIWPAAKESLARRSGVAAAVAQQQKMLPQLSREELWRQMIGGESDEPCPEE